MSKYNKRKNKEVALKYNPQEDIAPIVIASGYGNVAEKIIDVAENKGIPVFRDESAASLLCMLEVGKDIPSEFYEVVSNIYINILDISTKIKSNIEYKISDEEYKKERNKRLKLNKR